MNDLLAKYGIALDAASHRYTRFGLEVYGVTSCLPYIKSEYLEKNPGVMEKAGKRGHGVAEFIEQYEKAQRPSILFPTWRTAETRTQGYLKFVQATGFRPLASPNGGQIGCELIVYHDLLDYCGTLDLVGVCENLSKDVILIDVKATALIPKTVGMQTAAYLEAYNRNAKHYGLPKAKKRACLHLSDKYPNGYRFEPLTDPKDFGNFCSLMNARRIAEAFGCSLEFRPIRGEQPTKVISDDIQPEGVFA